MGGPGMSTNETSGNPLHTDTVAADEGEPCLDDAPTSPESFEIEAGGGGSEDKSLMNSDMETFDDLRQSSWWHASMIIVGEVLGTGIMGLPAACAKLGWFFGFGAMALSLCSAIFSGVLLSTVRTQFYPNAASFGDVAK